MSITTTHPQYSAALERWVKNRDFCKGEMAVKAKGRVYLPDDNEKFVNGLPTGESVAGPDADPHKYQRQYFNYLKRATLLAIAQHTRNGLVGMVFNEPPVHDLPVGLEFILENADGSGQSLEQLGKFVVSETIEVGRVGLLVDMPPAKEGASKHDVIEGNIRPRILVYNAESIVDWDEETIGSLTFLSFVKLRECYYDRETSLDDYGTEKVRYRILRLTDEGYTHQIVEEDETSPETPILVKMFKNQKFNFIPFFFVGAENNKPDVDDAPISGIVDVNASHYINTADNEQLNHLYALPTLHLDMGTNSSADRFKEMNPNGAKLGCGLVTDAGGTAALLQIEANGSLAALIKQKEDQAEKIGARFAGDGNSKDVTAEAARINAAFTTSTLTTVVTNVSEALEAALEAAAMFMGIDAKQVKYKLNTQFYGQGVDEKKGAFLLSLFERGDFISPEQFKIEMDKLGIDLDLI
jgi:hypothetical protein